MDTLAASDASEASPELEVLDDFSNFTTSLLNDWKWYFPLPSSYTYFWDLMSSCMPVSLFPFIVDLCSMDVFCSYQITKYIGPDRGLLPSPHGHHFLELVGN